MCCQFCTLRVQVTFMRKQFVYEKKSIFSNFSVIREKNCGLSSGIISAELPKPHSMCRAERSKVSFPGKINKIFCKWLKNFGVGQFFGVVVESASKSIQRNNFLKLSFLRNISALESLADNFGSFLGLLPNETLPELSRMNSMCPKKHFEEKNTFVNNFVTSQHFRTSPDLNFFSTLDIDMRLLGIQSAIFSWLSCMQSTCLHETSD